MSAKEKDNSKTIEETNEVQTVKNEVLTTGGNSILEALKGGNLSDILFSREKRSYTATSKYLKMEDGEVSRFVALEVKTMFVDDDESNDKDAKKEIPCLVMVNEDSETVTAAQMKLVNALVGKTPCFVEVESLGKVSLGKGKAYNDYIVTILD